MLYVGSKRFANVRYVVHIRTEVKKQQKLFLETAFLLKEIIIKLQLFKYSFSVIYRQKLIQKWLSEKRASLCGNVLSEINCYLKKTAFLNKKKTAFLSKKKQLF